MAEAASMMNRKYPEETNNAYDITNSVWHWSQDADLVRVRDRLCRMIIRKHRQIESEFGKGGSK